MLGLLMNQLKVKLTELNDDKKVRLLALLLHNITIGGRLIYSEPFATSDKVEKLYCLSEIQHKISGFMLKAGTSDEIIFDDLFEMILNRAEQANCKNIVANAIKDTFSANDFN